MEETEAYKAAVAGFATLRRQRVESEQWFKDQKAEGERKEALIKAETQARQSKARYLDQAIF